MNDQVSQYEFEVLTIRKNIQRQVPQIKLKFPFKSQKCLYSSGPQMDPATPKLSDKLGPYSSYIGC